MYIQNDPISPGVQLKNRCYVWDRLKKPSDKDYVLEEEMYHEDSQDDI